MTVSGLKQIYLTAVLTVILLVCVGCVEPITPLPKRLFNFGDLPEIPLIVFGEVLARPHSLGGSMVSEWTNEKVQLFTVPVRVQKVIQGTLNTRDVDVYYFAYTGGGSSFDSWVIDNLPPGEHDIFFLQYDRGHLRTTCDGWRRCIWQVMTGSHSRFYVNPSKPPEDVLLELLLSRGDNTTDKQLIQTINMRNDAAFGTIPAFEALRKLARDDPASEVRSAACGRLKDMVKNTKPNRLRKGGSTRNETYDSYPDISQFCSN